MMIDEEYKDYLQIDAEEAGSLATESNRIYQAASETLEIITDWIADMAKDGHHAVSIVLPIHPKYSHWQDEIKNEIIRILNANDFSVQGYPKHNTITIDW